MSVEHMAMVFAADGGLDGPEKLLLLAYTNYTDMHGYCWPSEKRLADDCGTSHRTVQRVKARLVKKRLLKSVRRKSKTTGDPISNLSRINLPLLASMARKRDRYDDDLIGAITFDDDTQGDPETTLKGTPDAPEGPSDLLTRHDGGYPTTGWRVPPAKMAGTPRQDGGQSRRDPVVDPEGNLSLSSVVTTAEDARALAAVTERETMAAPTDKPATQPAPLATLASIPAPRGQQPPQPATRPQTAVSPPSTARTPQTAQQPAPAPQTAAPAPQTAAVAPSAPSMAHTPQTAVTAPQQPAPAPSAAQRVVDAYTAALGRPVPSSTRSKLAAQAAELLADGFPEAWLADRARELPAHGWTDLAQHVEKSTVPLPGATPAKAAAGNGLPPWCGTCNGGGPAAEHNPRMRYVEDLDGNRRRCPDCHPDAVAQQPTRRGHQPHRDPVDQSVYDQAIG